MLQSESERPRGPLNVATVLDQDGDPYSDALILTGTSERPEWQPVAVNADGWRPLLVLVSGAPGSGKTTLAKKPAAALGLPHLNRDEIWSGLRFTIRRGAPEAIRSRGIVAEYGAIEHMLAVGVSLVADGTMYRGEFEHHVRRLRDLGEVVNVHCRSTQAAERYRARERARNQPETEFVRKMERLPEIWPLVVDPLDLSCRLIEVSNESGYDPTVDEIAALLSL